MSDYLIYLSVRLSTRICVYLSNFSVCLVVWQFVAVTLNGEVEASKCGNGDIREFEKTECKKQHSGAWVRKG